MDGDYDDKATDKDMTGLNLTTHDRRRSDDFKRFLKGAIEIIRSAQIYIHIILHIYT